MNEMIKLNKQKHDKPEFDELSKMLSDLEGFLSEETDFNDKIWMKNLETVLDFQDWKLQAF